MPASPLPTVSSSASARVRRSQVAALLAAMATLAPRAWATLPEGANVIHGDVAISTAGSQMTVNQTGRYGIVNWNSFSVGSGSSVRFNNGSGATLNRVTGLSASRIDGTVSASGSLFLLNRNGIILGSDGRILTGGDFVGSTRDMDDADFLDGGDFTLFGNSTAGLTNLGKISSTGGNILLAGYTVKNSGSLEAPAGRVGLAAGGRIDVLTDASWMNGAYAVSLGERGNDITNEGRIQSLVAELRAHNGNIYALAGNNTGLIQATGVRNEGGRVVLTADGGTVQSSGTIAATRDGNGGDIEITADTVENFGGTQDVSGKSGGAIRVTAGSVITDTEMLARGDAGSGGSISIDATREILFTSAGLIDAGGRDAGGSVSLRSGPGVNLISGQVDVTSSAGTGGTVDLLGDRVSLFGALLDASGATGGGEIHVGGGYQGASVQNQANSSATYISDKTILRADATGVSGDGGTVVAWSDGTTQFAGTITARSGTASGDGGTVETSGLAGLGVSGTVDASARGSTGADGRWLLDPKNITIGTVTDAIGEFQSVVQDVGGYPTDNSNYTSFGSSVDLSGTTAVIGSSQYAKAAYIFENGQIAARLTSSASSPRYFGMGVQIVGDYVGVMDAGESYATGNYIYVPNGNYSVPEVLTGMVYLFRKGAGWRNGTTNLISRINSYNREPDGTSQWGMPDVNTGLNNRFVMFENGLGNVSIAVGDPLYDYSNITNTGAVYSFSFNPISPPSGLVTLYSPSLVPAISSPPANLGFGDYIAADNGYLFSLAGTNTSYSSSLWVYNPNYNSGNPLYMANYFDGSGRPSRMAADDGKLLFLNSSGLPYYAEFTNTGPNYSDPLTFANFPTQINLNLGAVNNFARNIAVDGDNLMVSGFFNSSVNFRVLFFSKTAGSRWTAAGSASPLQPVYTYTSLTNGVTNDFTFYGGGSSMAIDGDFALAGAPGFSVNSSLRLRGYVAQFRRTDGTWAFTDNLVPAQRYDVSSYGGSIDLEGDTWVIGDKYHGDASLNFGRVFVYENGRLAATLTGGNDPIYSNSGVGTNVAINGNRIVTDASSAVGGVVGNRIYLFDKGAGWRNGTANLASSIFNAASYQSFNVVSTTSLAFDGNLIAFGRPWNSDSNFATGKGLVSLYQVGTNNGISNVANYTNPVSIGSARDFFGASVAVSGNTLVVGAVSGGDSSYVMPEYLHFYEKTGASWSGITPTSLSIATVTGGDVSERNLGSSLALDGNTLVAGYLRPGNAPAYVFERNGTWAASTTPTARLTSPFGTGGYFGGFVSVNGDNIAVTGYDNVTNNALAFVYQKQGDWRDGTANLVASFRTPKIANYFATGPVAIFGDTVLLSGMNPVSNAAAGIPVSVFKGPYDFSGRITFANGPGDNLNISAAALTASLSLGTNVTLQANNDIILNNAITVDNPNGDGGDLSLFAGRRIVVNASIFTDNGDLTLVANAPGANPAYRDSGERVVVLGRDSLNASVTLSLGTGNLVIAAADRFENRTGATNPFRFATTNPGRWLVYSSTPDQTGAPDLANLQSDLSTAGRDWVYYGKTFDLANPAPASLPAGDGFLYAVQPTLGVSVGNASFTYGQAFTGAPLSLGSVTVGGSAISTATFGLAVDSAALANLVTVGLANTVSINSANGFANAGVYSGGITATAKSTVTGGSVYGLAVTTSGAGTLTVAQKTLVVRPADATRVYRDANPLFTGSYTGFVTGDSISVLDTLPVFSTVATVTSDVGGYSIGGSGGRDNNYAYSFNGTGLLTVTPRDLALTGLSGVNRVYNATTAAAFTGTPAIAPLGGDAVTVSGALTATASFATANVGANKPLTFSGFGLAGAKAGNYRLVLPTTVTASVTPATLTLGGLTALDRDYDRTVAAALAGTPVVTPFGSDQLTLVGTPSASFLNANAGVAKPVTVSGLTLGGTSAANYVLASSSGLTATIRPRALDVAGLAALDRVYDASVVAPLTGTASATPLPGDTITVSGIATGAFADRHVGNDKPVTVSVAGLALGGPSAANYVLRAPSGLAADITPADLLLGGLVADDRVYDASLNAPLSGTGVVTPLGSDRVTLVGGASGVFADKHVGTAKPVTLSGLSLTGSDAANYNLVYPTGLTASVTPRSLTLSGFVADDKVYDATKTATGTGTPAFGGILPGDDAILDASAFGVAFADKNAGSAKPLVISGLVLTGTDAANYDITSAGGLTASIAPAPLTVTGVTALDRAYDSTRAVALSGGVLSGVLPLDSVSLSAASATGTLATKDASLAPKPVTVSGFTIGGDDAGNYALAQPSGLTATISRATLNFVGLSADKIYDGTASAALSASGFDAVFTGDLVSPDFAAVTASYADKNAGVARSVALSGLFGLGGADAANYTLTQPAGLSGTIAPRAITVSGLTIADKTYDGTRAGQISGTGTFGGVLPGDDLAIDVGAIDVSFADANAGVNKTVALSGVTLSGADKDNYTAATPSGITATIFRKDLTVAGLAALDRVYDRTLGATLTGAGALVGVVDGETITLDESARSAAFADKHVGDAKPVTVSGLVLRDTPGGLAANYRLVAPSLTATITPAFADVTGLSAANRVYDTTTNAPLAGTAALDFGSLNSVLASAESVTLTGIATGSFADKNASLSPKAVTVTGLSLAGADAGNYVLRQPSGLSATVARADLAVAGAVVANKTYDATLAATLSALGSVTPLGSDSVSLVTTAATASFLTKDAALAPKPVTVTGYVLSGDDAGNYTLLQPSGLTASISRAELRLTGLVADDKTYDGTRTAPLGGALAIAAFGSDDVTVSGAPSATFADKQVGLGKTVTVSGLVLAGSDAENYTFVVPTLVADIAPRTVVVGGLSGVDRVYNGTAFAGLTGDATFAGYVAGDDLTFDLSAITATFADKRVATDKPVTLGGFGLRGSDAANYAQVLPFDVVADIAAKELSVIGADAIDRIYDRTLAVALQGGALAGAIVTDAVSLVTSAASGTVTDRNAQTTPKPVTVSGYALSGDDKDNYTLAQPAGLDVVISPRPLDIAGVRVADKLFDGTTRATISGGTLANTVAGDDIALVTTAAVARFETPDIANGKTVLLSGFTLAGADATNYVLNPGLTALGRILPALKDITDVVPAEVLRTSANSALEQRRAALAAAANARADQVKLFDFQALSDEVSAGLVIARPVAAIYNTPIEQQDDVTRAYIAAANAAQAASRRAEDIVMGYRYTAIAYKETGQKLNQTIRELSVERDLRATRVAELEQVKTQLAQAEKNLEAVQDAKRNIVLFTQKIADATRLGRGSEVAEYERILSAARAVAATEAENVAKRDALAKELPAANARVAAGDAKVAELEAAKTKLESTLVAQKETLESTRAQSADAKVKADAANKALLAAQAVGAAAYADAGSTLAQADALRALASSETPAKAAAAMVETDPFVQEFAAKAATAAQVTSTIGQGLSSSLSPSALAYARSVAEKINSGGVLDDSAAMRDALVRSVPALRTLQTQLDAAEQRQTNETAAFEARIAQTIAARVSVSARLGETLTPEQQAQQAAQERARLNDRLNQLTGGALDLSKVPTKNADGEALTELERISIAILNKQLNTPKGAASEAGQFASGYKDRLNEAVAEEFGFSPEQALNDPRVLAREVVARNPINADGSLDKEQLAENLKTAASAYVNLNGALKDEAIKQAATQDPTGAAQAYVDAEKAARNEFVKTYGAEPEDLITDRINARIDAYKNADSPQALLRVHAAGMVPGGEMTIEQATKAYNDLKAGKSPDAVAKDMASNLWNGDGQGPSAREQAAQAARTAEAAKAAAISSLEESDKTGLFKASNTITGAAGEEFAKTFGGTPQELGIKALENPADAANQVKNAAKDIFTTPDGALNAVKGGIATYSNMADATLNAAKQQLDVVGAKFGDAGKAAAFVAKYGITAATEVKNFLQDAASTVTFGLVEKSGPSKSEIEAGIAFAKAQEEVARAEAQKREDQMLLQYFAAAQELAQRKAQMAAGVVNAKAQVGQYLVAAQAQAKQEQTAAVAKEVVKTEFTRVVQTSLNEKADATQSRVASKLSTEQMQAKASLWASVP